MGIHVKKTFGALRKIYYSLPNPIEKRREKKRQAKHWEGVKITVSQGSEKRR